MKHVIIFICPYGALCNGKPISKEFARCFIEQFRHKALGWTEDPDNNDQFFHFYKIEK